MTDKSLLSLMLKQPGDRDGNRRYDELSYPGSLRSGAQLTIGDFQRLHANRSARLQFVHDEDAGDISRKRRSKKGAFAMWLAKMVSLCRRTNLFSEHIAYQLAYGTAATLRQAGLCSHQFLVDLDFIPATPEFRLHGNSFKVGWVVSCVVTIPKLRCLFEAGKLFRYRINLLLLVAHNIFAEIIP